MSTFAHGTTNGYVNRKCRCPDCREANRLECRSRWARRKADRVNIGGRLVSPLSYVHGTANGYGNHSCRCPECTAAWTDWNAQRREAQG